MPRFPIRPIITTTKAQGKAFLRRLAKSEGVLTKENFNPRTLSDVVFSKTPSSVERTGTFTIPSEEKGMERTLEFPIDIARAAYEKSKAASTTPLIPGKSAPAVKYLKRALPGETSDVGAYRYQGIQRMDVATEAGKTDYLALSRYAERLRDDEHADVIWRKVIKGGTSAGGVKWRSLRDKSKQAKYYETAGDYFKSMFIKWKETPKQFTKNHPVEADLLLKTWDLYIRDIPEGLVK